jgi:hypothetical protein
MKNILDKISPNEALEILKLLAKADKKIQKKIFEIAEKIIKDFDLNFICNEVFWALDGIDVHELWNRAGKTLDGYVSPDEMAIEMVEQRLDPFQQEIFRLLDLGLQQEAKLYCMGVLKGLYMYEHDSKSEFKDWSTEIPGECFHYILHEWEKRTMKKSDIKEMKEFLNKECENWLK